MPYTKVCIHYVWSTKDRVRILTQPLRHLLFDHIRKNAAEKKIHIDRMNGYYEHIHCLVWLKPTQSIDKIAQLLKGESAHWFNNSSGIQKIKLEWQDEYFAVSVSESMVPKLRMYIDNQEIHHRQKTFQEEYEAFMRQYDFPENEQTRD
ncbi:MAG: IS200/IS605 family transposase [Sediminibacterium sp.]|nr:IS200/IS605 family transposase [Sediminibacterium sp.]